MIAPLSLSWLCGKLLQCSSERKERIMSLDLALLILRVAIGGLLCAHGAQKLFGWFGGKGLAGTHAMIQSQRMRPVWLWIWTAL